jgi:apolipoprotein N-acyltransferase
VISLLLFLISAFFIGLSCQPPSLTVNAAVGMASALFFSYLIEKREFALWISICFGFILTATQFHWVGTVFQGFTNSSTVFSFLFACCVYLLASFQFLLVAWLYRCFQRSALRSYALSLPVAWTIAELAYPKFITWYHGSTQIAIIPLAQLAALGGPALVSFVVFWWASLLVKIFFTPQEHRLNKQALGICFGISFIVVFIFGFYNLNNVKLIQAGEKKIRVALVQPNLNQRFDFTRLRLAPRVQRLKELTSAVVEKNGADIDLVIWPESAVGYSIYSNEKAIALSDPRFPLPHIEVPLLFGGQTQIGRKYTKNTEYYNSAYLLSPQGRLLDVYHKQVLFPFSERVPLSGIFPKLRKVFKPISNYREGEGADVSSIVVGDKIVAVRICFEDILPNLFRANVVNDEAQLLVSLSNDGWFSESAAVYQHHLLALWRAVENQRYLVRAGNNGMTELVDPTGRVLESIPLGMQTSFVTGEISLLNVQTFFSRFGFVGLWTLLGMLVILAFATGPKIYRK